MSSASLSSSSATKRKDGHVLFNVCGSREVFRIASDIDRVRALVNADVVDSQRRRERQCVEINSSEVFRYTKISDEVYIDYISASAAVHDTKQDKDAHIGSWVTARGPISTRVSAPNAPDWSVHAVLLLFIQEIYWRSQVYR